MISASLSLYSSTLERWWCCRVVWRVGIFFFAWMIGYRERVVDGAQTRRKKTTLPTKTKKKRRRKNGESSFFFCSSFRVCWLTHTQVPCESSSVSERFWCALCTYNKCNWLKWMRCMCICLSVGSAGVLCMWRFVYMKLITTDNWIQMCVTRFSLALEFVTNEAEKSSHVRSARSVPLRLSKQRDGCYSVVVVVHVCRICQ